MRTLILDIETSPAIAYTFTTQKAYISNEAIIKPTEILCFAAKWVGEKKVRLHSNWVDGHEGMVEELHRLLDEADAIVSYNGITFDVPHINREFITHGWFPPSPYQHIDLYMTVRSKFRFMSGKMDYVCKTLDLGGKMAHEGFGLWRKVMEGDPVAQRKMGLYNQQDVRITEALYMELRPWIKNHPNVALIDGIVAPACPRCGSFALTKRGFTHSAITSFQRYQCNDCGGYTRSGKRSSGRDLRPA